MNKHEKEKHKLNKRTGMVSCGTMMAKWDDLVTVDSNETNDDEEEEHVDMRPSINDILKDIIDNVAELSLPKETDTPKDNNMIYPCGI